MAVGVAGQTFSLERTTLKKSSVVGYSLAGWISCCRWRRWLRDWWTSHLPIVIGVLFLFSLQSLD